jgi:hypothetical protein
VTAACRSLRAPWSQMLATNRPPPHITDPPLARFIRARVAHFCVAPQLWGGTRTNETRDVNPDPSLSTARRSAAMLANVLAGESPAGGTCPVTTVAILSGGEGDRTVESPSVKVPVGWEHRVPVRSTRGASKPAGCSECESESPEICTPTRSGRWGCWECRARCGVAKASTVGEGTGYKQPMDFPGS